uniref:ABC transporter permease n=1 Tax=Cellvibrio fontiphilus TaxID=1815559 RepID=UPI002B4BCA35|nr:ABC transporter permease [Cellvibrio fontiphilus]
MNFTKNQNLRRYLWPCAGLLVLMLVNAIIAPEFFTIEFKDGRFYGSLIDVLNRAAPVALLAIGMSLVIATAGVDLSVGSIMAIAGAVSAYYITKGVDNLALIIGAGLIAGLIAGIVNGFLVGYMSIQPIVATLILMVGGRGIAQLINEGQIVTFDHSGFAFLGTGSFLGLPFPVVLVIITFALVQLLTRRTALGLYIEAVGANPSASHYMGLNAKAIKLSVYVVAGLCAALAGMIAAADIRGSDANNAGLWLELDAILAVVIGGASLMGGRFSIFLAVIGALIIQTLTVTIILSGIEPKFNLLIKASAIILVLLMQSPRFQQQLSQLNFFKKNNKEINRA